MKLVVDPDAVEHIVSVLDANDAIRGLHPESVLAYRILQIAEETGEACKAFVGMVGHDPLKGVCSTLDDVTSELCNVVLTAIVALATAEPERWPDILTRHLHIPRRAKPTVEPPYPPGATGRDDT